MSIRVMRTTLHASVYLIFAMTAVVLFTLGPRLESAINPVIGGFQINERFTEDGRFYISGVMLKNRGECELINIYMYADGGETDETAKTIRISFNQDPSYPSPLRLSHRPAGSQYWGPWEIFPPDEPIGPMFTIVTTHRCHALWELKQTIYTGATSDIFPGRLIDQGE